MPPVSPPVLLLKASTYSGSGPWLDQSGNNKNATLITGIIKKNSVGNGIVLNGYTNWTFPNVGLEDSWTINMWYKDLHDGPYSTNPGTILTQEQVSGGAVNLNLEINSNSINVNAYDSSWTSYTGPNREYKTWVNLQATWDGSTLNFYKNGKSFGTSSFATTVDGGTPYYIGSSWNGAEFVKGEIGEIRMYNYAISQEQMTADYISSYETFMWQPTSISGLRLWFDGADETTIDLSGSTVTQWRDKSGLNKNSTAVVGTPTFTSGTGITFDGSSYFNLPNDSLPYGDSSYSIYVVFNATSGISGIIGGGSLTTVSSYGLIAYDDNTVQTAWNTNTINTSETYTFEEMTLTNSLYQSGGQRRVFLSGIEAGSDTPGTRTQTNTNNTLGAAPNVSNMNGIISEVLVYNTNHTTLQRQIVEGYLAWKWGLTLPTTHPFYSYSPNVNESQTGLQVFLKASDYSGLGAWLDQSGQGRDATLENGIIAKNVQGNGIVLNGGTSWTFPNVAVGNQWTASVWYKNTGNEIGGASAILTQIYIGTINLIIGNNDVYAQSSRQISGVFLGPGMWYRGSTVQLVDYQWTNIQVTWDGTTITTYINGVLLGTTTPGGTAVDSGSAYRIGRRWDSAYYMTGEIGEVRIYNYPISATQVLADYEASAPTFLWQPTAVSGLKVWLDVSDQASLDLSGSTVTQWNDKSGQSNDAVASGSPQVSSSSITFNGTTDYFTTSYTAHAAAESVFIVYKLNAITETNSLIESSVNGGRQFKDTGSNGVNLYRAGEGVLATGTINSATTGVNILSECLYDLSGINLYSNGTLSISNSTNPAFTAGVTLIGGNPLGGYLDGSISEVLIYNRTLTVRQRQIVEGYLVWKWGLQASLPITHPFKTRPPSVNESATGLMILLKASTYSGTGAWLDESGQGRNATLENGVIAKNAQGNGIVLNGSTNWTFPNVGVGNAFTANVWYKNTGGLQAYSAVLTQLIDGISVNIGIGNSSGDATIIYCNFNPNYWNQGLNISPYLPIGKWVNIQMTWDGTTINVYINGVLLSTATPTGPAQDNGLAYRIGRSWSSPYYVTGEIGEVRIYNYAIDQAKVTSDYLSSAPTFVWQLTQISGLQLWLDGADPNGNYSPSADASTLTTWVDKSGQGVDASAAEGITIIKNSIQNGLSVVRMDGTQRMDLTLSSSLSTYTIFTVQWCSGNSGTWQRLLNGAPNSILLFGIETNSTNVFTTTGYGTFDDFNPNSPTYDNNQIWRLVSMLVGVSRVQSYVDGNAENVRIKSSAALSAINIGSEHNSVSQTWRGDIGEILVYSGVVSHPQRQTIEGYLAWKWGLQGSLPITHPFYSLPPAVNEPLTGLQVLLKASDYSGSGAWLDQSGKGRNATLENGIIAKNAAGNGIVLNGSTNWTFPNVAVGNQWTASVWYKNTGNQIGGPSTILTQLISGTINLTIGNNDTGDVNSRQINGAFFNSVWYRGLTVQLVDNQWTNIQVTWDGTNMITYINGYLLGSTTPGETSVDNGLAYRIGRRWDTAYYMTGEIGEVRIYNYAISQSQVSADYLNSYQTYAWTPTSISGLSLWFDGSDQSTIDLSGAKVTQWRDKSGLNKNTTTVTGTPTFTPGAGVVFDGSSSFGLPNSSIPFGNSSYSIYVVLRTSASANNGIIAGGAQVNNQYLGCQVNSNQTIMNSWYTNDITSSGTSTLNQSFLAEFLYQSGGQRSLFITGAASGSDTPGTRNQPNTGNTLGNHAGNFMNGLISEVLVYNTNHTQGQRQVVEGYLAWKWGLSLPSTHPFYKQPPSVNQNLIGLQVQLKASTYSGSGQWLDESGFNRNAVMTQGIIAKNVTGNGIYLDGSTRWTFPNVAVGNAWSVNIWFKKRGDGNGLLGQNLSGYMNMNILNDQSNVGFYSGGGWYYGSTITLRQGAWTNIQVTWDGTNMITYINGVLLGSVQPGGTSVDSGLEYFIGKSWQDSTSIGDIGEVSIYNYPISQSQVTANYTSSVYTYIWQPIQLTGLKLWLDAKDQASLDLSGSTVTQWNDKSGQSNDAVASGTPQLTNGSVVFNGSTDYFTIPYTSQAAAETMFIVFKPSTTDQSGLVDTTVASGRAFQYQGSTLHLFNSGNISYIDGTTTLSIDTTYIAECSYSSAGSTLYVSGNQDGTNGTNATFGGNGTTLIGAGYYNPSTPVGFYLNGTISEVIIYNRVLTQIQRQIVEGYLAWKWGLSLPSTHIFYSRSPNINEPQNGLMVLLKAVDYSGSGAWLDESSQNCNATLENGQIAKNTGGNGIVLNGYTSWTFPNVAVGNQWTASVWYKNTGDETGGASIILSQLFNNAINLSIGTNDLFVASSRQIIGGFLVSGGWNRGTTVQLMDNQWTNIQVTWDGTNMKTYLNGVLLGSTTPGGTAVDSGRAYIIGRRWDANWYVKGEIGEVRIYNYAITQSQVTADYQASVPTFLWNPTQISGLQLWLDGNDQTSLALSGSSVTQWNDKSGLNNNTTTVTGTPTFSASGVVFDGSSYFGLPDGSIPYGDSSYSIYAVINFAGPDGPNYNVFGCGSYAVANSSLGIQNSDTNICVFWGGNNFTTTTAFTFSQPFVFGTAYKSGSIRTTFSNGTSVGTDTPGIVRVQIPTNNYIGTWMPGIGTPMLGTISEFIVYNKTLTKHQSQLVEGYLAWKWSLQSQLPSSHPFYTRSPIYNESQTGLLVFLKAVDYSGSGPWLDQSGYGRNATKTVGTIAKNADGNGIVLDGSTYWTFPNIAAGNLWTISVWYKDASSGVYPALQSIVTQQQAGTSTQVNIALTFGLGTSGQFSIGQYNGDWNVGPSATINNNWTNIQASWDGTTVKLYKNGALVSSGNFNNLPSIDGGDPYFIGRQWNADNFIRGEIGEVRIYNYALIQDDLLVEYLAGLPIFLLHPTSISGCQLWFDGADSSSITFNTTTVTQWNDKSGLNNNTSSIVGTPTYTLGSGVVFNGSSYFTLPDGSIPYGDSSYSIYIVAKASTGDSQGFIGGGLQELNKALSVFYSPPTGSTYTRWFTNDINTVAIIVANTFYLAESLYQSGGKRTMFINAATDLSDTPGPRSQPSTGNVLGSISSNYSLNGVISEILVYNINHSKRQRQIVEGYLAWKWGLQAQLPTTHLFYNRSPTLNESLTSPVILLKAVNYSGSGIWYDDSGYGRNATLENGTIAKNAQGNGIILDGSTNWTFPNVAVGNAWTASVWYKNTGDEIGGPAAILTQLYNGSGFNLSIGNSDIYTQSSRQINCGFYNVSWSRGSTVQLVDNQWTNIQVTWDGTNMVTYINGVLLGTTQPGGIAVDSGQAYRIGRRWDTAYYMTGEIGEVRIYDYPLTQAQVKADYQESYKTFITPVILLKASTYSGTGPWNDESGNDNNATLENGTIQKNADGNGIVLNGSTSWIFPNIALGDRWTLNVWYKNIAGIPSGSAIVTQLMSNYSLNLQLGGFSGGLTVGFYEDGISSDIQFLLVTNNWINIQATWDGTDLCVYINGLLIGTTQPGGTAADNGQDYRIGAGWDSDTYVTGEIGEVRIYNFPLIQYQVTLDYQASAPAFIWQPTSIPGLQLWFDANDYNTLDLSGSNVNQWNDKSGNSNNTTSVYSVSPVFHSVNYQPTLNFNNTSGLYLPSTTMNNANAYSVVLVYMPNITGNVIMTNEEYTNILSTYYTISDGNYALGTPGTLYWNPNDISQASSISAVVSLSTIQLVEIIFDGTVLNMFTNGSNCGSFVGDYSLPVQTTQTVLGNYNTIVPTTDFNMYEFIYYNNAALSLKQRQNVEGYLSWKWGVPLSSTHPYYQESPYIIPPCVISSINITKCESYTGNSGVIDVFPSTITHLRISSCIVTQDSAELIARQMESCPYEGTLTILKQSTTTLLLQSTLSTLVEPPYLWTVT